jgi:hypothetical protein
MKASQLFFVSAVGLMVAAAQDAHAQTTPAPTIPTACNGSVQARNAYNQGLRTGGTIVSSSWRRVNDCDRLEYFLGVVEDNVSRLTLPTNASLATVCRYTGTVDGVYNGLDSLYGTCSDQCFLDGEFAGEMSAEVYCELSIALGGLAVADDFIRGPVQVCGFNFEVGCDAAFIATTASYANTDGTCEQFTEGEFFDVWDQARNNQCAYEPEPDPISSDGTVGDEASL